MFDELAGEQKSFREKVHDFFTRPSNPRSLKLFGISFLLLCLILGGIILSQGPLFHSDASGLILKQNNAKSIYTQSNSNDPFTTVWSGGIDTSNLNGYDTSNKGPCVGSNLVKFFSQSGTPTILMNSSSIAINNVALFAVSQARVDLSLGSAKELSFEQNFMFTGGFTSNTAASWGWYLTTNATAPRCDEPNGNYGYTPEQDPNVALIAKNAWISSSTVQTKIFLQREPHKTISSENLGSCTGGDACFLFVNTVMSSAGNTAQVNDLILNFTGHTATGGGTGFNGVSLLCVGTTGASKACSIGGFGDLTIADGMNANGNIVSTSVFPWLDLATPYYLGYYAMGVGSVANANHGIEWMETATGLFANNFIDYFVPIPSVQTPATPDTGGFFGPIIKALISIGVFIIQNVIGFLGFLANLLWPTLTAVFTALANAVKLVLNSLGNFFGLGNIGDELIAFFSGIANWLTSIVGSAFGQILNLVNLLVQLLNWLASLFGGPIWTGIIGIATLLTNGWTTILTAYNFLTQLSTTGLLGINYYFLVDWIFGMFMLSTKGMEGFKTWIDLNELVFSKIAMAMFFFIKESFVIALHIKQMIVNWL